MVLFLNIIQCDQLVMSCCEAVVGNLFFEYIPHKTIEQFEGQEFGGNLLAAMKLEVFYVKYF